MVSRLPARVIIWVIIIITETGAKPKSAFVINLQMVLSTYSQVWGFILSKESQPLLPDTWQNDGFACSYYWEAFLRPLMRKCGRAGMSKDSEREKGLCVFSPHMSVAGGM